jgi:uncharacterized protein (DUF927 family)
MNEDKTILKRLDFRYLFLREDSVTGIHFATVSFPTGNGGRGRIEVPASTLSNRAELQRQLQDRDAVLPAEGEQMKALLSALAQAQPKQRQTYAKSGGWSGDKTWFVTGRTVIGGAPPGQLATRPSSGTTGESGRLRVRGSATQWRNSVGRLALSSSVIILAICAALAAPLLAFINWPSFSLCFFGRGRSGKSLASLCGASMIGIGEEQDLIHWLTSETAIEQRLPEFMDMVFVLDDVSTMRAASDTARYEVVRNFAYMVATNQGKARAREYKTATGTSHSRFQTIALTSAEKSITSLAGPNRPRQGGEAVRLIELPATEDGQDHIFDRMLHAADKSASEMRERRFDDIVKACRKYHGAAFREYISSLIGIRRGLRRKVKQLISEFARHVVHELDGTEARDLAKRFGVVFAGGMIGIELNAVSWTKADVLEAITTCYHRARRLLTDDGLLLRSGLKTLHDGLKRLPLHTPRHAPAMEFRRVTGYRVRRNGETVFVIKGDAFNELLSNGHQRNLVQQWLLTGGRVAVARTKKTNGTMVVRPKDQIIWPDGKRRRSFEITGPFPV